MPAAKTEVFLRLTGSLPVPLFDTQLAAAYLGMAHSMGYSKLVKEVLDIDLPKTRPVPTGCNGRSPRCRCATPPTTSSTSPRSTWPWIRG